MTRRGPALALCVCFLAAPWVGGGEVGFARAEESGEIPVALRGHAFAPERIEVRPGDRLVFRNEDPDLHSLVLIGRGDALPETFLDPGQSFVFEVPAVLEPGVYALACTIHVDMRAELAVNAP